VIWLGASALPAVKDLVTEPRTTGDTVRGTVDSSDLDRVLEKLRQQHARLISVTPIHRTLEDYFLASTREEEKESVPS
jgi:type II secretory pathway component PulF